MKRLVTGIIILMAIMFLSACGGKNADDPVTKVTLGMTFEQALEAEPELTEYEGKGYSCTKSFADEDGTLLISLSPLDETVFTILWQLDPTDGQGKNVYDTLLSELKKAYGKPGISNDKKDVESVTGIHDEAQARWEFKDYTVSCSYIEYHKSGKCQIQYKRGRNADNMK